MFIEISDYSYFEHGALHDFVLYIVFHCLVFHKNIFWKLRYINWEAIYISSKYVIKKNYY